MNCITLTEPWATLVAIGAKTIETRSWKAPDWAIGQPLAIHAAKGLTADDLDWVFCEKRAFAALQRAGVAMWDRANGSPLVRNAFPATRGRVLATCRLAACLPTTRQTIPHKRLWTFADGVVPLSDDELAFGNYEDGRYAWVLRDVVALPEPPLAKGALGIWQFAAEGIAA